MEYKNIDIRNNVPISPEKKTHITNIIKQLLVKIGLENRINEFTNNELHIIILDKLELKEYNRKLIIECVDNIIAEKRINNLIDTINQETQTLLCAV